MDEAGGGEWAWGAWRRWIGGGPDPLDLGGLTLLDLGVLDLDLGGPALLGMGGPDPLGLRARTHWIWGSWTHWTHWIWGAQPY